MCNGERRRISRAVGFKPSWCPGQDSPYAGNADIELFGDLNFGMPVAASRMTSSPLARAVGARPLYFPSRWAFAISSRWRSSMISRSNCATDPLTFSISRPLAVVVSRFMARTRSDACLASIFFTMLHRSATERASRSSFVTMNVSPSRRQSSAASSCGLAATLLTFSVNSLSIPIEASSRSCASRPASCSVVEVAHIQVSF